MAGAATSRKGCYHNVAKNVLLGDPAYPLRQSRPSGAKMTQTVIRTINQRFLRLAVKVAVSKGAPNLSHLFGLIPRTL